MSRAVPTAPAVESATWHALTTMIEPCVVSRLTIPGEPASKERPRFDPETGHVYTPRRTADAETALGWVFKSAVSGWQVDAISAFGVMCLFRCATTRGKRDVDNLLKLILDGLNGVAWKDDVQVHEVAGRVVRGAPIAGTDVLIYRIPQEVT